MHGATYKHKCITDCRAEEYYMVYGRMFVQTLLDVWFNNPESYTLLAFSVVDFVLYLVSCSIL